MTTTSTNWTFDELTSDFEALYERVRGQWIDCTAKVQLLQEMVLERYQIKDYESEVVKVLEDKRKQIHAQEDKLYDVQKYLNNLRRGYPFNVSLRVGRYMVKFGLTQEQTEMFLDIHKNHMAAMGADNQKKYSLLHLQNIIWDQEKDCLKVYYEDIWWHYDRKGQWW